MAKKIKSESINELRDKIDLKSIVEQTVTLKSAGIGNWKGLCPFHDEKTPSFTVKPQTGFYKCFGCGESGDVYNFVMKTENLSFVEAVEDLAERYHFVLQYEIGGPTFDAAHRGSRQSILKVNQAAMEFYESKLLIPEAQVARDFLIAKGFTPDFIAQYSIGYAPNDWEQLFIHLKGRGYSQQDMMAAGLLLEGKNRRVYDRFRGRVMWPIKDVNGTVLGFGARKLYEDDPTGKYINTAETAAYHKSKVLYGLDKAKKPIVDKKQVVVVEGYTDVMACHAAGIDTALATCGTAFGEKHIQLIRRLMGDDTKSEVIFTFDGDEAGRNAALKAFALDQQFLAHTYVAVDEDGLDPNDIRLKKGDQGLVELLKNKVPLFEFVLRTVLDQHSTSTIEQRSNALEDLAPVLNNIKDPLIKPEYVRQVASWLGFEVGDVENAMKNSKVQQRIFKPFKDENSSQEVEAKAEQASVEKSSVEQTPAKKYYARPNPNDAAARIERQALEVVVQYPQILTQENKDLFLTSIFETEAYNEVAQAIRATLAGQVSEKQWMPSLRAHIVEPLIPLLGELALAKIPVSNNQELQAYGTAMVKRLAELELDRAKADAQMRLSQLASTGADAQRQALQRELLDIEIQRRELKGEP